ncbi:M23 family metallopeptidase [Chamaesiphon sp. VAR_69_metabat_338]|uniref:M23 family metallopeptidase n=1 Tax=Chamaesiphon sp. VAR_69_metabat_338 TaxID=2964704 RepID=UPI00286DD7B1|nr:M23 family metallopeptidase [Chamaesiphon sp. VAR_69_metabat_338]
MKPEITQQDKLGHRPNVHRDVLVGKSSAPVANRPSGMAKVVSLFGNHRSLTSSMMVGLTVLIGIATIPANYPNSVAAAEAVSQAGDLAVTNPTAIDKLQGEIAAMRAQHGQPTVRIAQSYSPRTYPAPVANPTLNFNGEASVPIEIAPPKQRTFKAVATASPYAAPNSGSEGDLVSPEDRLPSSNNGTTTIDFSWPTKGTITSRFGRRWGRMHKGIDIAAPIGTPINAAADGTIVVAGYQSGYGNLVEIRHLDGTTTRYGHNSELSVSVGQSVRQGQQVARMGSTGHSTGSHLHFEIRPSGGSAVNPIAHLPANS